MPEEAPDRIRVRGIEGFGHHGVFAHERRDGQRFSVDLELALDLRPAGRSDDLQDTVDYGSLVTRTRQAIESDPVDLIETLAERISLICLDDPRVRWVEVTVHKPEAPIDVVFADLGVTITRTRTRTEAPS